MEKRLFIKGFLYSGIFRLITILFPIKFYLQIFESKPKTHVIENDKKKIVLLVKKTIKRISYFTPWECKCLVQAITSKKLLSFYGIHSIIALKILKTDESELIAHAKIRTKGYNEL